MTPVHLLWLLGQIRTAVDPGQGHNKIRLPRVQQQQNGVDCGVFAIAFATEFCFAKKELSKSLIFDTKLMRPHLIQCIEFGKFTPFPKRRSSIPPKRLSLSKKDVEITISKNCKSAGCDYQTYLMTWPTVTDVRNGTTTAVSASVRTTRRASLGHVTNVKNRTSTYIAVFKLVFGYRRIHGLYQH